MIDKNKDLAIHKDDTGSSEVQIADLTAKQLYEIGVRHISGACTVQVVY